MRLKRLLTLPYLLGLLLLCLSSAVNARAEHADEPVVQSDPGADTLNYVWDPANVEYTVNLINPENYTGWTYDDYIEYSTGAYMGSITYGDTMADCNNYYYNTPWTGTGSNGQGGLPCVNMNLDSELEPVIRFSYGHATVYQTIQVQKQLQNLGYDVVGFRYGWEINNVNAAQDYSADEILAYVYVWDSMGNLVYNSFYDWSYQQISGWNATDIVATLSTLDAYPADNMGIARMYFHGQDGWGWQGYYGPKVRGAYFEYAYVYNPCYATVLADPSCDGYADAFAEQQYSIMCSADPLYDSGCPGYDDAYFNYMCNINPTYSIMCPNYPTSSTTFEDQQIVDIVPVEVEQEIIASVEAEAEAEQDAGEELEKDIESFGEFELSNTVTSVDGEVDSEAETEESKEQKEKSKKEKLKKIIAARLATLTKDLETASIEDAKALQEQVLALMNFTPGFAAYKVGLPDGVLYESNNPYENLYVPDSRAGLRNGLAQELKHREMVLAQYN